MGKERDPGLVPQSEPLIPKVSPQIIQEGFNIQESHQGQKTPPLCRLHIWGVT